MSCGKPNPVSVTAKKLDRKEWGINEEKVVQKQRN